MLTALNKLPKDSVYTIVESPVNKLWLIASSSGLHAILWEKDMRDRSCRELFLNLPENSKHPVLSKAVRQLGEYFAGERKSFALPLAPYGTEFQMKVWLELGKIPYGKTISYAEQAARMGDVKKARAVGTANSRNPISIVVPCHRVIAKNGDLSGFGGGVPAKRFLLKLEQATVL